MYDTVKMRLLVEGGRGVNLMEDVPPLLESPVVHHPANGGAYVSGLLGNLHIIVDEHFVRVTRGSLCKWHLGDNLRTLDRKATQEAIEHLTDTLHLPMDEAEITRLDFGTNLIMQHPVSVYLGHLGLLRYYSRVAAAEAGSLYYQGNNRELNFYDKGKEQSSYREIAPEPYRGRNVLRYEMRIKGRVARQFKRVNVTAANLYDRIFFDGVLHRWRDTYRAIQKLNDRIPEFDMIRKKTELYRLGVLLVAEAEGGQQALIGRIKRMQTEGKLTKQEAYSLRQAVNDACKFHPGLTSTSEVIEELNGKVAAAANMY